MSPPYSSSSAPIQMSALLSNAKRFEIFGELGRGASAIVYDVYDRERNERVALKLVQHRNFATRQRLETELAISNEVAHLNLVRVLEVSELDGAPFMLMERVLGTTLNYYVHTDRGKLDETRVRSILVQLIGALDALHAAHRVHRDVKPGNLRVTSEGRLVLLDFGIAAEREDLVWAEPGVGTPAYMAPEQVSGGPIGPAADLYAVGAILYELLTSSLPHPEAQLGRPAVKLSVPPKPPSELQSGVPRELEALCLALLARDPEQRPDAAQVLKRLGMPVQALRGRLIVRAPNTCIGRTKELSGLKGALLRAKTGGAWLHVVGPVGRGKHTLVDAFLEQAARNHIVLRAKAFPEKSGAFGGLDVVIRDLADAVTQREIDCSRLNHAQYLAWLSQMFPGFDMLRTFRSVKSEDVPVPDPIQRRLRALRLLREIFEHVAKTATVVVCVENFTGDERDESVVFEQCLLGVPNVFVLTTGTTHVRRAKFVPEICDLSPLEEEDARALLAFMWENTAATIDCDFGALIARAQHEPWALIELARERLDARTIEDDPERALARRFADLSPEGRLLLRYLLLLGFETPQNVWLEATSLEERPFHRGLFELLERGFITRHGGILDPRYAPVHARIGPCALKDSEGELAEVHENLARCRAARVVLQESDRAYHLERAGETHEAARIYEKASALCASRLAFAHAANHERKALLLDPPSDRRASQRRERLAHLVELSGDPATAADLFEQALLGAPPSEVFELKRRRTDSLLRSLRVSEGLKAAREALSELGVNVPETENNAALSLICQKALLWVRGTHFRPKEERRFSPIELSRIDALLGISHAVSNVSAIGSFELQTRGFRLALREREPRRIAQGLGQDIVSSAVEEPEPHTRSFERLKLARELSEGDPLLNAWLDVVEATAHFFDLHPTRSLPLLDRAERLFTDHAERPGPPRWVGKLLRLDVSSLVDPFVTLESLTNSALEEAQVRGDRQMASIVLMRGQVYLSLFRDCDPDAAEAVIDEAMRYWPRDHVYFQHFFELHSRGICAQHRCAAGELAKFEAGWKSVESALFMRARVVRSTLEGTRAGLLIGEIAAAQPSERAVLLKRMRASLKMVMRDASGIGRLVPLMILGSERWLSGRPDEALAHFQSASSLFQERGITLIHAYAEKIVGTLLGGDEGKQRAQLADEKLRELGARKPDQMVRSFLPDLEH